MFIPMVTLVIRNIATLIQDTCVLNLHVILSPCYWPDCQNGTLDIINSMHPPPTHTRIITLACIPHAQVYMHAYTLGDTHTQTRTHTHTHTRIHTHTRTHTHTHTHRTHTEMLNSFLKTQDDMLSTLPFSYASINVLMPHYHIYGLRWGEVGICTLGKYKSQCTGATMLV